MATQENRSMVSEVSICNQALLWLGSKAITSLSDDSKEARWMKNNYPFIRDAVLEERNWTFATARASSTVNDLDAWGRDYVHPKPADWLLILRVYRDISNSDPRGWLDAEWRMENNQIHSKQSTVYFWGLKRIVDTGAYTQGFVQALAARLAADACIPLTENVQLQRDMWSLYGDKLREAAARDGQQGSNDIITETQLTNVRVSGGYIGGY